MRTLFRFFISIFCFVFLFSCGEDEECRKDRYVRLGVGFYKINVDVESGIASPVKLVIDSITVNGLDIDSLLYNNAKKKDSVRLPLNKLAEESTFRFIGNDTTDTFTVYYQNNEEFLSFECGCLNTFTIDVERTRQSLTTHYIDSIVVTNPEVNTLDVENIQIYHNPR